MNYNILNKTTMDLDDIFENSHKRKNQNYDHNYKQDDDYRHDAEYRHENEYKSSQTREKQVDIRRVFLESLRNNPNLKILLIIVSVILIIIVISLIVLFLPVILKLFGFVTENGVEGLLNTIWKGTK